MKTTAAITGVQGYLPEHILSNEDLAKIVDTNDEWITSRTGIKERRIMKDGASSDMAVEAVNGLLKKTNTSPNEVDLVILATVTPDYPFPSTANVLCDKTGMKNAWGFDLIAACSGFIYGLSTGAQFIETGKYKKVVVSLGGGGFVNDKIRKDVLTNHFSFWLNWDDLVLIKRIKGSKKRPLASKSTEQEIKAIINKRKKIYSKANFKINCNKLTKSEIVKTIIKTYEFN